MSSVRVQLTATPWTRSLHEALEVQLDTTVVVGSEHGTDRRLLPVDGNVEAELFVTGCDRDPPTISYPFERDPVRVELRRLSTRRHRKVPSDLPGLLELATGAV